MSLFAIQQIHHVSIIVSNTDKALDFYHRLLGLPIDENRPDLGFAGAWLKVGEQQIHLLEVANPDPVDERPEHGGRDRHTAFNVLHLAELITRLEAEQIPYTLSRSGRKALFCRDGDGNTLEFIETSSDQ